LIVFFRAAAFLSTYASHRQRLHASIRLSLIDMPRLMLLMPAFSFRDAYGFDL